MTETSERTKWRTLPRNPERAEGHMSELWRFCCICWESVNLEDYDPLWQACSFCAADLCREEYEQPSDTVDPRREVER